MPERLSHLRLDRLDRNPECARDLGVAKTLAATELEYFAARRRKLRDCGNDRRPQLTGDNLRRARRRNRVFSHQLRLGSTAHVGMTQLVQRPVTRRAKQVRAERFVNRQLGAAPPELEHHFLRGILGRGAIAQQALRERHQLRVVRTEYGIERVLIAGLEPVQ